MFYHLSQTREFYMKAFCVLKLRSLFVFKKCCCLIINQRKLAPAFTATIAPHRQPNMLKETLNRRRRMRRSFLAFLSMRSN